MRIAIDTTPLSSGHKDRGVGSYTSLLVEALALYGKQHSWRYFDHSHPVPADADIIHYPYFDPFFLTLPLIKPKPTVVTVHDLIPLIFPDKFPAGIRGTLKWYIQRFSLSHARHIIADSQASKKDIEHIVGIDTNSISVIPLAPSAVFKPIEQKQARRDLEHKYNIHYPYLLYVGDVNWNKNVRGLIEAFAIVKKSKTQQQLHLVLVGRSFLDTHLIETKQINALIKKHALLPYILRPGYVANNDLVKFYACASVYVQPSYYEGFGLPVLEAMASGCRVVTSEASSLREIAGPAVKVDPTDPPDMAQGISATLKHSSYPDQKSLKWVSQFSWERVAKETLMVYEKVRI